MEAASQKVAVVLSGTMSHVIMSDTRKALWAKGRRILIKGNQLKAVKMCWVLIKTWMMILCYSRTLYLQIHLFTLANLIKNANCLVKNGLFICKFNIRGPNWWNVSTANNEVNLYPVHACILVELSLVVVSKVISSKTQPSVVKAWIT